MSQKVIFESLYALQTVFPEEAKFYEAKILQALGHGFDLSVLKLPRRVETILKGNGITNTVKLKHRTNNDLIRLNGIGKKYLEEIGQRKEEFFCTK